MPAPADATKLTNVERWSVLAKRIHDHRHETEEWVKRHEHEAAVRERRHLTLVQDDDRQPH
jgi:hypothetical protein